MSEPASAEAVIELAMAAFDAMPLNAAVLDAEGEIMLTNAAWDQFGDFNGAPDEPWIQRNYLHECDRAAGEGDEDAAVVANGIRSVLDGFSSRRKFVYNCDSPDEARLFRMTVGALRHADQRFAVVVHNNVTPRAQLDPSG